MPTVYANHTPIRLRRSRRSSWPSRATLFETSIVVHQSRLFNLAEALGEEGWLKAIKLEEYAPHRRQGSSALQQVLFAYMEAV